MLLVNVGATEACSRGPLAVAPTVDEHRWWAANECVTRQGRSATSDHQSPDVFIKGQRSCHIPLMEADAP